MQQTAPPHRAENPRNAGAELADIEAPPGHESIATTQIYTNVGQERMERVVGKGCNLNDQAYSFVILMRSQSMSNHSTKRNFKKRKLKDDLMIACSNIAAQQINKGGQSEKVMSLANQILKIIDSGSTIENADVEEGDYIGPITGWIEHADIDESTIAITNISNGSVKLIFEERIWSEWNQVNPNGQATTSSLSSNRKVDSDFYDGDHRLKTECGPQVSYHLKFESKDN